MGVDRDVSRSMVDPDQLDRQIISMLQADGRCSNREIARNLGVPGSNRALPRDGG